MQVLGLGCKNQNSKYISNFINVHSIIFIHPKSIQQENNLVHVVFLSMWYLQKKTNTKLKTN